MPDPDHPFPDAPMIARLRRREAGPRATWWTQPKVTAETRGRIDDIRRNHPFPEEVDDG